MERLGYAQTLVKIEPFKSIFRRPFQWDLTSEPWLLADADKHLECQFAVMQTVCLLTTLKILVTCHCAE